MNAMSKIGMVQAERTINQNLVNSIVTTPELWETVAEDGHDPALWEPDFDRDCWLLMSLEGLPVGLYQFKTVNAITLDVHPHILPEFRGSIGMEAGRKHLEWVYNHAPKYKKLVATIPMIYRHVKLYANMLGYRDEGINRASFLKNGQIHDQWNLGITRDEIERRVT